MTKSPIPTPEEALALQNIMPQGPMPTPAGNGYAQWAADPQNSQKIINSLVPPGQSIMPAQPPPPAPMSPANPSPASSPSMGPIAPQPWTPPEQLATASPAQSAAPMPTASAIMPPSMQGQAPAQQAPLVPPGAQAPAPNQIPQIQSYKDWAGANPDMLDKASLKGRGPGRIALGSLIAAAQGFAGGLKGNPGAGVEWAQGQMQHDQNLPTINQQRYNAAVVTPAQAALALQDTNSQINQRNAAAAKSTAQAGAIGDDTKGKAKAVTDAAKLGMVPVYDEQGNLASFAPDANSPIAKKQQAALDFSHAQLANTQAQKALRDAQTEVAKAKNDPGSTQNKLAMGRLAVAQKNAATASGRLGLSQANYQMHAFGTDAGGNELPGVLHDENGVAVGSTQAANMRPTATQKDAAGRAESMVDIQGRITKALADPEIQQYMGPVAGRVAEAAGQAGVLPEKVAKLRNDLVSYGAFQAGLHPVRGIGALQYFDKVMGGLGQTPEELMGKLSSNAETAGSVEKVGTMPTTAGQQKLSTAPHGSRSAPGSAMSSPPNKQPVATHRFNPTTMQVEEIKK